MRFDRFTIKAQEALETAQSLATDTQSPELGVEHLMLALIRQTDGIVTPILQKLGVDTARITSAIETTVQKAPKVQGTSEPAKAELVKRGFDAVYGARPLRRTLQRDILNPLAIQMLEGTFHDGNTIAVNFEDGEFAFQKA